MNFHEIGLGKPLHFGVYVSNDKHKQYDSLAALEAEINQSNGLNNLPDALQKYL